MDALLYALHLSTSIATWRVAESYTHSHIYADSHCDSNVLSYTDRDCNSYRLRGGHGYAYCNRYSYRNRNCNCNCNCNCNSNPNVYPDSECHGHIYAHSYRDSNVHSDTYRDSNCYRYSYGHGYAYRHTYGYTNGNTYSDSSAWFGSGVWIQ